ncbi:MAG: tRNA (adenosine(37)-N6)-dimethylallyltransferase MiaA [Candidatus Competibacteraceae bacterium]
MGPTASGKTGLAVELVKRLPVDIISVDSALVYRGMDIGTAKPDAETQRIAPHRLIDIMEPCEAYSAAQFRHDALQAIADIQAAGRIPLLVGGTMLYYRALQQGLAVLPPADAAVRAQLDAERVSGGLAAMHTRLMQVDPVAAARIHPHDPQRIQRALEVYELTGKPITELYAHHQDKMESFRVLKWVVAPRDRLLLHERIKCRFHAMLTNGFVSEVEKLRARGDLSLDRPAIRAVGYRQIWQHLDGILNYTDMVEKGVAATRQLAKRQLTWLRSETKTHWLDSQSPRLLDQTLSHLRAAGIPAG